MLRIGLNFLREEIFSDVDELSPHPPLPLLYTIEKGEGKGEG